MEEALGGRDEVASDWASATDLIPLAYDDPGVLWLEEFGEEHGFYPDFDEYSFGRFVAEKGRQFQEAWIRRMLPDAPLVCEPTARGQYSTAVQETAEHLESSEPAIVEPAFWWAPDGVYGVPDLVIRRSLLRELVQDEADAEVLNALTDGGEPPYVVVDLKFTSNLTSPRKSDDLEAYRIQLSLYTYLLSRVQPLVSDYAYLITRDRVLNPILVELPLEGDGFPDKLSRYCDEARHLKREGRELRPGEDDHIRINFHRDVEKWKTAKKTIRWDYMPGGDIGVLPGLGAKTKRRVERLGYSSLDDLLDERPRDIAFQDCKGIGVTTADRIRSVLIANGRGEINGTPAYLPETRDYELFVDFEYFTNINVDFENEWPELVGTPMIFMIGVGWREDDGWNFESFTASTESHGAERDLLLEFLGWLDDATNGSYLDEDKTVLYHWSSAETWQARKAARRHGWEEDHPLRNLPWEDLQAPVKDGPLCLPGMWGFGLKEVASALFELTSEYGHQWPEDVGAGLEAMVMGWRAYQTKNPLDSQEIMDIREYLEIDCRSLERILAWLRQCDFT